MITIRPVPRALVPVDSRAAGAVSAPNYDEFQGDREIWAAIQQHPDCVLKVTMAHCDVPNVEDIGAGDSEASLGHAGENARGLAASPLTRELSDILFVYEITGPQNPGVRQIGLGGMALTSEIRTEATPAGPIIRNEGVRESKARGRANLIEATHAIVGTVNLAVPDAHGRIAASLESVADGRDADLQTDDQHGNTHRVWLLSGAADIQRFQELFAAEPEAYVADGNHRSAAAAMLGHEHFLTVFFTADRMGISPYNRLVVGPMLAKDQLVTELSKRFAVNQPSGGAPFQPTEVRSIGLYSRDTGWLALRPLGHTFDSADAAQSIDHDIVQRCLFEAALGIPDARDERLTFVGANKDAGWLRRQAERQCDECGGPVRSPSMWRRARRRSA